MLKLNVEVSEVNDKEVMDKLKTALYKSMFKIQELAIKNAPHDIGYLKNKINLYPDFPSNELTLESEAPYSEPMEFGTRPFWVPIEPLREWAKRKIGDPNIGYAIRAKIAKEGIDAHPFMRPAFYEGRDVWVPYYFNFLFDE